MTWTPGDLWDPSNPENRDRTRRLTGELRELLVAWDPIGVGDVPEGQDEYDGYISPLLHRLHRGEPADEIAAWLTFVVTDLMDLAPRRERERQFAESLVEWWARATITP